MKNRLKKIFYVSIFEVFLKINELCLIDQIKLLCSIGSDKYILFDYISGRYDDSISDKISGKITRMYCKYEKVLLVIERGKREVCLIQIQRQMDIKDLIYKSIGEIHCIYIVLDYMI